MVETERKRRKIFCCGAKPCAFVIAFIDLLFSIFSLLNSLHKILLEDDIPQDDRNHVQCYGGWAVAQLQSNPYVFLLGSVLGGAQCAMLLMGIIKTKPSCLLVWIVINGVAVALIIFSLFVSFLLMGAAALVLLVLMALPLAFEIFGIWIISVYREEMVDDHRINKQRQRTQAQSV